MLRDSNRAYQIYHSILGMILTLALLLWINEYFVLRVHIIVCILYCLVHAILIHAFDRNKKNTITYLVFAVARTNPITWANNIIDWVIRYDRTKDLYEILPAYTVMALVSILVSILLYLLVKRFATRLFLAVATMTLLIVCSILEINILKIVVGISIFFIVTMLIEFSGILYSRKSGKADKKESILYLLPVCVILAFIATALPSKPEPIQWTGVKTLYYNMRDYLDKLTTEWEFLRSGGEGVFSISLSGYSGDGSLDNDDVSSSNKVALIVRDQVKPSPIYLTGSVSDVYTGYSWEKSKEDAIANEHEYQMDYGELLYGLSRLDPLVFSENRLVEPRNISINYNNIKTKTFFYPSKSREIDCIGEYQELDTEYSSIVFSEAKGKDISYSLSYYDMNLQDEVFKDLLRSSDKFSFKDINDIDYEAIKNIDKELFIRKKGDFLLDRDDLHTIYKVRVESINKKYTQLPENLPSRVKELAYELTKDEKTSYDKLKAIESYLINYTYTYTPGSTPDGSDFVDYFLFDNKKGYCTSFGTAMAVLGRCIGIPTRYVEGYVVDYDDRSEEGFLVRNSDAHAWAEAYFEGVGWIPFEATPSLHEQRYTPWPSKEVYESYDPTEYYRRLLEERQQTEALVDNVIEIEEKDSKADDIWVWIFVILSAILLFLLVLLVYYHILRRRYIKDMKEASYSKKMYLTFIRILILIQYEGFHLKEEETLLMLSDRVKDRYKYNGIAFDDVINVFMAYRYGEVGTSKLQYEKVATFYDGLMENHISESKELQLYLEEFKFLIKRKSYNIPSQD